MSRALVVDDDDQSRYLLEVLLSADGFDVETATNGKEALAAARRRRPDLVVSDILMPGMDGFLLCREMKADPALVRVPFVFYTATYTEEEDERVALKAGCDLFLRKPAEPEALLARIHGLLDTAGAAATGALEAADPAPDVEFHSLYDGALARKLEKRQEQLQQSEGRYRSYFLGSPVAIAVVDATGRVLDFNPAACRLSGYDPEELRGMELPILLGAGPSGAPLRLPAAPGDAPLRPAPYVLRRKDGVPRELAVTAIRLDDEKVLAFCEDVTERVRAEEAARRANEDLERRVAERTVQLEHANRELEAFTYSVSHDLRAPLRAVEGYSQLLEEKAADRLDAESRRLVASIRQSARRLAVLIDDLLSLSKAGRRDLHVGPIDMQLVVKSALEEVLPASERARTEITIHPLPPAAGDEGLVRQVWTNLLGNAVKFSSKKPRRAIEVGAQAAGSETAYFVRDDGVGFDPACSRTLFDVFSRLDNARDFEGTGIGLALVRRIVERHGGRVWAEGSPGSGATFWFVLGEPEAPSNAG